MTSGSLVMLALAMALLAATPGPGVLAVVARALGDGFGHALLLALGVVLGDLLFLALAICGLAALAALLGDLFLLVRFTGAAYLIWLGVRLWRGRASLGPSAARRGSGLQAFAVGLAITLGNPKVVLFYLGLLPTLLPLDALSPADIALTAAVVAGVLLAVLAGYALAADRARRLFTSATASARLDRGAGGMMIGAGVMIATR